MTTITVNPDIETGSITLDILKTVEVSKIIRTDVNGSEEVRTSAGQLPSAPLSDIVRTNLITNPSFETGTTDWTFIGGLACTVSNPTTGGLFGSRHARVTTTASNGTDAYVPIGLQRSITLTGGKAYVLSFHAKGSDGMSTAYNPRILTAGGALIDGTLYSATSGDWTRRGRRFTVPGTGAQTVTVQLGGYYETPDGGVGGTPVGSYLDIDAVILEEAPEPVGMPTYFDGATTDVTGFDYAWTGTAHASTSTLTAVGGRLILTDYEAAHGLNSYNVYTADGTFVTASATLTLDKPWLSVPVMPQYSEQVETITQFGSARDSATTVHRPLGRADSLVVMGKLGDRTGSLQILCRTYKDARTLERIFERGEVVQLRQRVEGMDMYFTATGIPVAPQSVQGETETRWLMSINYVEVRRPIGSLAGALGWNFDELASEFATFDAVAAAFLDFDALTLGDAIV